MSPKKSLGQHFLTEQTYAERIVNAIPDAKTDSVLEIGPGKGALSIYIKSRFPEFHLVEIDASVISLLREKLGSGNWTLHNENIFDFDYSKLGFPIHVVGNLPYNVAAPIIHKTLLYGNNIRSCTFMVQKEVARRIVSGPDTKENGYLSIFCQFFGKPEILFTIPPGAFFPKPKIDSAVFQIIIDENLESKLPQKEWKEFFRFVSDGFLYRRKKLLNVLAKIDNNINWDTILNILSIYANVRAENLGIDSWLSLYKEYKKPVYAK